MERTNELKHKMAVKIQGMQNQRLSQSGRSAKINKIKEKEEQHQEQEKDQEQKEQKQEI